jgi:hypothetical protein
MDRMPSKGSLATLKDGYQLFQETRTGLFYLTAHSEPLRRRPDFAGFLEREITARIDISALRRFLSEENRATTSRDHEVSFELIQRTASLSKQLNVPVLAAEITDDEYGMAVMVNEGALQYLRVKTSQIRLPVGEALAEVSYTVGAGFSFDCEPAREIYALAQTAIEEVFKVGGLALYNYVEEKPSKGEARENAGKSQSSVKAYLDSFGVFKRLSHARPQLSPIDRMLLPFRYAVSMCLLPFMLAGMTTFVIFNSGKSKTNSHPGSGHLFFIGFAVLAIPILFLIWAIRSGLEP